MDLHVMLQNPAIPNNTGNIIRTTACTGDWIHLVKPLGFTLDDTRIKRAGLDYHDLGHMQVHESFTEAVTAIQAKEFVPFTQHHRQLNKNNSESLTTNITKPNTLRSATYSGRIIAFSSHGKMRHDQVKYRSGDILLFGTEPTGLPPEILYAQPVTHRVRIPMLTGCRSLNLSNSVAIALFEAWRQMNWQNAAFSDQWRHLYRL